MENQTTIIKILLDNKQKILKAAKFDKPEFDSLISKLNKAEEQRKKLLQKIKDIGELNIEKLSHDLGISRYKLTLKIDYLKELGFLKAVGKESRFFQYLLDEYRSKGIFPNVSIIKEKNLCCNCGLCVSVCPLNAVKYSEDTFEVIKEDCINCGLCFACCPRSFFPITLKFIKENEDIKTKFSDQINYYREVYTAQTNDNQIIEVAQDGGIVTSLLKTAFQVNMIDCALAVGLTNKPHKPAPIFVENVDDLLKTAGTKYSNTPSLKILHESKKYKDIAIVGTPCMMEGLKKISIYPFNEPFYDNIAIKIGLFCMESFDYSQILELLKNEFQKPADDIIKMNIDKGRFLVYSKDGTSLDVPLKKVKKYGRLGCFFCDDLTAEQADISVGSIGSEPGWSTVIIRTQKGADLFQKALDLKIIEKKEIKEDDKSFVYLGRIAKSKKKTYKEGRRPKMIEQDPKERIKNFDEVPFGLTEEMVKLEAQRCLQCGRPLCIKGCPVNINIPEFIRLIKLGKNADALHLIKRDNLLPAICGRVCPQETQCEEKCLLNSLGEPISIGYLERFLADWERKNKLKECPDCQPSNNIKVAVIGSGPAGLTCAGDLAMKGYNVTLFEAFHAGGGVLVYGIPEFRLPKEIVKDEIETLKMLGVKINYNTIIGKVLTLEDLKEEGFRAFFIGVGAGLPMFLRIPGLSLNGVLTANEFLTRSNLMKAYRFPEYDTPLNVGKIVTVIGGGNVALDSARTALRLGSDRVIIVYRRSEKEMPARLEEIHHAKEEGVEFQFLTNPTRIIGDENDNAIKMECLKMKLGEPDDSGRRSPIPIKDSEFIIETDTIILAIGALANPVLTKSIPDLILNKWGYIVADPDGRTSIEGVYAGGDIVTGSATVISAMGAGRISSLAIDKYLRNKFLNKVDSIVIKMMEIKPIKRGQIK